MPVKKKSKPRAKPKPKPRLAITAGLEKTIDILTAANEVTKKLTVFPNTFQHTVQVNLLDGSVYIVRDAEFQKTKEHLIIYPEHGHPLVFDFEMIHSWWPYKWQSK